MDWRNRPASVRIYVSAVVGGGVAVYLGALYRTFRLGSSLPPEELVSLLGILLVAGLSARWVVRIPRTTNWMAVADCLIIAIVMIYGLAPGIVAHGLFHLVSYWFAVEREPQEHRGIPLGWSRLRAIFNLSSGALQALAYGTVFIAVKPDEPVTAPQIVFPVLLVGLTYFLVNGLATHLAQALSGQAAFWELWRQDFPLLPIYFVASACGAAIVYLFHQVVGAGAFALALPFWVVAYYAHRFYKEKYEELAKVHRQTLEAFAFCIDAMELHTDFKHHTHTHIQRTQALTLGLARALNVDERTYEGLRYASVLHDVGKISIPSYILHKPTRLTEREFQKMSTHPAVGAQILASIDFPFPVVSIVKHHHENWDGSGYPDGLRAEEIPLGSRVLAIADCYEALTARRVYRRSLSRDAAVAIMKREAHKFDPQVFKRFIDVLPALEEELNSIEVRSLAEPKEHTDSKRDRDIVGQPKSITLSSSISEPQQEIFTLFEIFQNIGNSLSRNDTLTILASKLEKIVPFTTLVIYLADEGSGELRPAHIGGSHKEAFSELSIEIGTRLAGWVAANNRFLYNVHPGPDTMTLPEEIKSLYGNSLLAPLVHEERPLGTIALYMTSDERYTDDHIRLMEIVSNRASIALFNAIRFEETQEDAFTDRLTGLPNSRFLYIFFEQTLSEAKRYGEPLTVIEMDLDDFKGVNDRYGHHSGDRFLKEVGRILKERMRDADVLVRYAGDEFIAVLPKTSYEQARQFSYRLQDAVEATLLDVGVGAPLKVGISLGLASYPAAGKDLESLLMAADKNMYEDKARRRGRKRGGDPASDSFQPSLFEKEELQGQRPG
jgi:diguanylate cyclase (GGDEF)-like protein/putative nucleotidyltransferase with HDIG domain